MPLLLVWALAACNSAGGGAPVGKSNDVDSGNASGDGGIPSSSGDSAAATGAGDANEPSDGSRGRDAPANTEGGGVGADGGVVPTDGSVVPADGGGADGGLRDVGSCCSMQTTPGCSNASLEVCVCEKDQSCCTTAWGLPCVLIVQQKYCQPTVRDCVCGTDAGEWGQTQCCTADWTSTCDSVATLKCNAVQGCF